MTGHCLACNHRGPRCWGCRHFSERLDDPTVAIKEGIKGYGALMIGHYARLQRTTERKWNDQCKARVALAERARWYGRV